MRTFYDIPILAIFPIFSLIFMFFFRYFYRFLALFIFFVYLTRSEGFLYISRLNSFRTLDWIPYYSRADSKLGLVSSPHTNYYLGTLQNLKPLVDHLEYFSEGFLKTRTSENCRIFSP